MGKKIVSGIMLTLLLIGMVILAFDIQPVKASGTIWIRSDGSVDPHTAPISSVDNVTYTFTDNIYESIVVKRSSIIIDGNEYTLQGSGSGCGLALSGTNNVTIKRTKIKGFAVGIWLLWGSHDNTISGNSITQNSECGILLSEKCYKNTISGNNITQNSWYGIQLFGLGGLGPSYNTISGNSIKNNGYGIMLYRDSTHNSIVGNNITNNRYGISLPPEGFNNRISANNITHNDEYGIWLPWGSHDNTISGNSITQNSECGIWLDLCGGNTIFENNVTNNGCGIVSWDGGSNTISGNSITFNGYGICLDDSLFNTISGNNITNNRDGIYLYQSSSNKIYHNNFIDNTPKASVTAGYTNIWDNGYPSGGNYWSDYSIRYPTVVDDYHGENQDILGSDGIWDSPYVIDVNNQDNYPFVNPWFLDMIPPVADAGPDQIVHEDTPVTLNGEASSDNVRIVSYVWTFTDVTPQTLTGVNPTYTFQTPGIYTVTLNVTDAAGNWATDTVIITVLLDVTSPVADAGLDQTANEDTEVAFDGSGSSDNVDIVSYVWNFGDGTTGTGVTITHTYTEPGTYTVTLNVTDARSNWDTDDVVITVVDVTSPVADAGPDQTVDEDTLVTLEGWRSTDNVGVISWTWTFIDVTPQTLTGENVTYTFTTPGIYTVTLEVSDAAGNHATDTVTITVLSLNPEELIQRLMETIESWNLGKGTENSLTSKLEDAVHLLNKGNENGAIHKLMDFISQVEALQGKKLRDDQADYLIAEAQRIIDLIKG